MENTSVRYSVEYYAKTIWDKYYSDRRPFNTEEEAIAFIQKLSKDPLVNRAFYTVTKEFNFRR